MKWILTFLAGALCGACALFVFFSMTPPDTKAPQSPAATAPAVPPPPVAVVPAPTPPIAPAPPAPVPPATPDAAPAQPSAPATTAPADSVSAPVTVAPPSVATPPVTAADAKPSGKLLIPVEGIKNSQLSDNFNQSRGADRRHEALDIMAPKGTKVVAVADGKIVKLFNSKPGGLTVYQFDTGEKFAYYYAHLDRYAPGITEGMTLKRGDLVGYVGTTGNADPNSPHLHFAVFELTPEKKWWQGTPLNPYPLMHE